MEDFVLHYYPMSKFIFEVHAPVTRYYYTSFFALLLVPIGKLSLPFAATVWGLMQFSGLVILCIIPIYGLLKLTPLSKFLYICLCITSFPVLHNIIWGQVSILITVFIITAFYTSRKKKYFLSGILLAFATAIKLYPVFFIIYFVLKRDIRTCVTFALAFVVFYLIFPVTVLGFSHWYEFEKASGIALSNANWVIADINSQYITHVGVRWFKLFFNRALAPGDAIIIQILTNLGYLIALFCFAMVWLIQKNDQWEKNMLSMVIIFLVIPFVLKTSWPHYFVYLPISQIVVISCYSSFYHSSKNLLRKLLILLPIISMLLSSIFITDIFMDWKEYNRYGILFLANLILLLSVFILVFVQTFDSVKKD